MTEIGATGAASGARSEGKVPSVAHAAPARDVVPPSRLAQLRQRFLVAVADYNFLRRELFDRARRARREETAPPLTAALWRTATVAVACIADNDRRVEVPMPRHEGHHVMHRECIACPGELSHFPFLRARTAR